MCVLYIAFQQHKDFPLILAGNRDEFYERPSEEAHVWNTEPRLLGGRDKKAGGGWLAVNQRGEWACVTNYRKPNSEKAEAKSRGFLVTDFLLRDASVSPKSYLESLSSQRQEFNGFNLLVGNQNSIWHYSNISDHVQELLPGIHGVSNALLDTPWPKVEDGKDILDQMLKSDDAPIGNKEDYLDFLRDEKKAPQERLPDTGIGLEYETLLSSRFIASPKYGTRASTLILFSPSSVWLWEKRYGENGKELGMTHLKETIH